MSGEKSDLHILKLDNLRREYKRGGLPFLAVDGVSLNIFSGERVVIIGRSGGGKSTLLNMAAGLLRPSSGSVELLGENLADMADSKLSYLRNDQIGFIPQGAQGLSSLTVLENVLLPFALYPRGGDGEGAARALLGRFGIEGLADVYPNELSGGELRRVLLARSLINRPALLMADEPTADLDTVSRREVMLSFEKICADGATLLIVSHDLDILSLATRIFTMQDGKLVEGNKLTSS